MSNLIVSCSIFSLYFLWNLMLGLSVRVWWRFMKNVKFATGSRLDNSFLCQASFHESLCDSDQVMSDLQSSLPEPFWNVFFSFLYQHYISPHYPRNCMKTFREKTLAIHLRVKVCIPIIIYTISLSFFLLPPLQLQILERFLTQTLTSPLSECW